MYPRQRPKNQSPQEVAKWNKSKVEWYKNNRPVDEWPWSVLRAFQREYGIIQSGARDLQNQRVAAFLKNAFLSLKDITKKTELPSFTRFPFVLRTKTNMDDECSILHIHKDVLKSSILMRLVDEPQDLFSLMMTCKDLQGICQEMICYVAQQRFGPQGTPKALSLVQRTPTNKKKKQKVQDLKKTLGLTGRDFKISNAETTDVDRIIGLSIKKYGLVDNLPLVRENECKKKAYHEQERIYILKKVAERVMQANARFVEFGYQNMAVQLSEENSSCVWTDARTPTIMSAFQNDNDYRSITLLRDVNDWVFMRTDSKVGRPDVPPDLFNLAMASLKDTVHPLAYLVLQALAEIKHREYFFYGTHMEEDEWKKRVANVFAPEFLQQNPFDASLTSLKGSWVCCWTRESSHVRLYCISDKMQYQIGFYLERMRVFENRHEVRLGSPSTNMIYTFNVPRYVVKGEETICFGHVLLTKF